MASFENHAEEARQIEQEIIRHGVALGIDWDDAFAVRALAREALAFRADCGAGTDDESERRAKTALFGLAQLMLHVMIESAGEGVSTHGGSVWKTFGRALWQERELSRGAAAE
jgi:hypothetical protein